MQPVLGASHQVKTIKGPDMLRMCIGIKRRLSLAAFVVGAALALAPAAMAASWTIQPTPSLPGSSSAGMPGVSCPSATWCAGVGYYTNSSGADVTLAEASNGTNWSVQSTPNPTGTSESFLTGVDCTAINVCTAVGHYYNSSSTSVPFAEARNGASWSLQSTPNPAGSAGSELIGISCWSPTGCISVGAH
jgi:hypothetical protein